MLVSMPLRFQSNSLLGEALPFAGEDPQLAQGRRGWLLCGQGTFQAQATEQADPAEGAEVRALRTANKRLAQELEILKKAIAIFSHPPTP